VTKNNTLKQQGVTLTGRNTTGPPSHAAPWWITLHSKVLQTMTDNDDRQRRQTTTDASNRY